ARGAGALLGPERDPLVLGGVVLALGVDEVQAHAGVDDGRRADRALHAHGVLRALRAAGAGREHAAAFAGGRLHGRPHLVDERVHVAAAPVLRDDLVVVVLGVLDHRLRATRLALWRLRDLGGVDGGPATQGGHGASERNQRPTML